MPNIKQLTSRIEAINAQRQSIFKAIKPLQDQLEVLFDEKKELTEELGKLLIKEWGDNPPWKLLARKLANDDESSMAIYDYATEQLKKFDMWHNGYWPETKEANFELKVEKTDESKKLNLLGLKTLAPLLTPHDDGYVWFKLFEYTLSRSGGYILKAKPDLSGFSLETRWNKPTSFSTPEEAIDYIQKHHWYGDSDNGDDEED